MAQKTPQSDSFWVSYSDLATGLMIVFMVVMLIMVIMQKQTGEVQTERIKKWFSKSGSSWAKGKAIQVHQQRIHK